MKLFEELRDLGLNKTEIEVYLYLLEHGLSTPPSIAKGTKIALTNTYHILASLREKDLIEEQKRGKRKAYLARDPGSMSRSIDKKKELLERILPDLRSLYVTQKNKPAIKFYDGASELEELFWQTLGAKGEIFGIASTKKLFEKMPDFFEKYRREIKKREIFFKDVLTADSGEQAAKQAHEELGIFYEYRLLDQKLGDIPSDILIWNDNIALLSLDEPVFGTVLTSKPLADSFKVIFKIVWESSRKQE